MVHVYVNFNQAQSQVTSSAFMFVRWKFWRMQKMLEIFDMKKVSLKQHISFKSNKALTFEIKVSIRLSFLLCSSIQFARKHAIHIEMLAYQDTRNLFKLYAFSGNNKIKWNERAELERIKLAFTTITTKHTRACMRI